MSSSKSNFWLSQLRELLLITFSILLAFGLNAWYANHQERSQAEAYLAGIEEELAANQIELTEKLEYHQQLLEILREDPAKARMTLRPANISNVAWKLSETAVFRKHIDPDLYKRIATAYQTHETLMNFVETASDMMSEVNVIAPFYLLGAAQNMEDQELEAFYMMSRQGWVPMFETWTSLEQEYLEEIEGVLE
ncbi:hypothetical protein [Pontibacter sp. G13]|uniref:hypothetical protein n=1 Tax=Pontibacter sp. G13 TaxID=3074898 RepID=UPI00288A2AA3|nr:hypothetical protein [Pontibacter sp. G13]WNJ20039.1 hypothetical protein RJD25_06105 [Pontibacter sp. G13]